MVLINFWNVDVRCNCTTYNLAKKYKGSELALLVQLKTTKPTEAPKEIVN